MKLLSHVWLFATLWTVAYQAPPSMGFSREECWRGLPFPSPGDLSDPGIEPRSPSLQADALSSEPPFVGVCVCVSFFKVFVVKHGHLRVCSPAKYRTTSYALFGQMMILSLQSTVHTLQWTLTLRNYSSFTWNSNVTAVGLFVFAKSGSPLQGT